MSEEKAVHSRPSTVALCSAKAPRLSQSEERLKRLLGACSDGLSRYRATEFLVPSARPASRDVFDGALIDDASVDHAVVSTAVLAWITAVSAIPAAQGPESAAASSQAESESGEGDCCE